MVAQASEGTARSHPRLPRVAGLREIAALALIALAAATILPQAGWNATAHYSLVESLADGTPRIDGHLNQGGDIAFYDGHFYAAKSPGLAFASMPLYVALDAAEALPAKSATTQGPPNARGVGEKAVWQVNLVVVLAFFVLLVLVRRTVDVFFPRAGAPVAVMLGLGSMLLPFATSYFSHVPAALLGFAAFALLVHRDARPGRLTVAAAGTVAGLAVFVEVTLVLVAVARRYLCSRRAASPRARAALRRGRSSRAAAARCVQRLGVRLAVADGYATPCWKSARRATTSSGRTTKGSSG